MDYLNQDEALREILRRYDRKPEGWKFLLGRDSNFWDILVIGPEEAWHIKVDTIFKPKPLGLGVRLEEKPRILLPKETLEELPYGFRSISPTILKGLAKKVTNRQLRSEDAAERLLEHLRRIRPTSRAELSPSMPTAIGPHLALPQIPYTSDRQKELNMKLGAELRRLLRREYTFYDF